MNNTHSNLFFLDNSNAITVKYKNNPDLAVEYISNNIFELTSNKPSDFKSLEDLVYVEDFEGFKNELQKDFKTLEHKRFRIKTKDGYALWVKAKSVKDGEDIVTFLVDIDECYLEKLELLNAIEIHKKINKKAISYYNILEKSYLLSISDLKGRIIHANDALLKLTGYTRDEIIGKPHSIIRHPDTPKELFAQMWKTIQNKQIWQGALKNSKKDGSAYYVQSTVAPILDENGEIEEFLSIRYDQSEFIAQQEYINAMAYKSAMTDLPNLYALVLDISSSDDLMIAIVNLDGFKVLNNYYGYDIGDSIIKSLAHMLKQELEGENRAIYHIHADEFAILCKSGNYKSFVDRLKSFQNFLLESPCSITNTPLHVTIATSCESKRLLVSANMAMGFARTNKLRFISYSKEIDESDKYKKNIHWINLLHKAIANDGIVPYFQPIYNVQTGKIEKFEALIRLLENGEVYTPFFFLDTAKKVKLYPELTLEMLEKTFDMAKEHPYDFSINLSIDDIRDKRTTTRLFDLLKDDRKGGVVLEIVESESIDDFEELSDFIKKVKEFDCKIAIDDFGSGYSNFEYLLKMDVDFIKIDGSLIKNIDIDQGSNDIVSTIVSFAKKRGIKVIAEFVSNEYIYEVIKGLDIEYAQGYFIAQPSAKLTINPMMIRCSGDGDLNGYSKD